MQTWNDGKPHQHRGEVLCGDTIISEQGDFEAQEESIHTTYNARRLIS